MKINQSFNNIEKSNLLIEGKQFSIDITPQAFQVLSGGMYKDRIGAIIRELSCNAWDSHVEAQNTKQPFDIFIPSKLSPVFYIRDYGTGLTKDEIETIYTCYFKSTKADTNKQLGCFGLGSKTPLSYTDQFSVTSYKDGKKYLYLVYIKDNVPSLSLLNEEDTNEHNGLKVELAIKEQDVQTFQGSIKRFFSTSDVQPNFLNKSSLEDYKIIEYCWKYKDLWLTKNDLNTLFSIKLGMVLYPATCPDLTDDLLFRVIDKYKDKVFQTGITMQDFTQAFRSFIYGHSYSGSFVLNSKIGEFDVSSSREGLTWKESTKEHFVDRLFKLFLEIYLKLKKDIKGIKTFMEAYKILHNFPSQLLNRYPTINFICEGIDTYNYRFNISMKKIRELLDSNGLEKLDCSFFKIKYFDKYRRYTDQEETISLTSENRKKLFVGYYGSSRLSVWNGIEESDEERLSSFYYIKLPKRVNISETIKTLKKILPTCFEILELKYELPEIVKEKKEFNPLIEYVESDSDDIYETELEEIEEKDIYYIERQGGFYRYRNTLSVFLSYAKLSERLYVLRKRDFDDLKDTKINLHPIDKELVSKYLTSMQLRQEIIKKTIHYIDDVGNTGSNILPRNILESFVDIKKRLQQKESDKYFPTSLFQIFGITPMEYDEKRNQIFKNICAKIRGRIYSCIQDYITEKKFMEGLLTTLIGSMDRWFIKELPEVSMLVKLGIDPRLFMENCKEKILENT